MGWLDEVGGLLQKYAGDAADGAGDGSDANDGGDPADHLDQVTQSAPQSAVAHGVASALQSDDSPGFGSMVSQMFDQGSDHQQAGILSRLLGSVDPSVASKLLGEAGLSDLADAVQGGQTQVTPDQAAQVPADVVENVAAHAAENDPGVIQEVSQFVAGHPDLLKSLGSSGVANILSGIAEKFL